MVSKIDLTLTLRNVYYIFLCLPLQPQQTTNSLCGSPPNSCQSCLNASQTSLFGGALSIQHMSMPSPPYLPYDNPTTAVQLQQFVDPYITGTGFQDYQGFPQNPMAAESTGYLLSGSSSSNNSINSLRGVI